MLADRHYPTDQKIALTRWCGTQRGEYRKGKLSQKRIDLLEQIEFIWDILDQQWNENYMQLKDFYEKGNY